MWGNVAKFVGKVALSIATMVAAKKIADKIDEMESKESKPKITYKQPKPVEKPIKVVNSKIYLPESDFQVN